MRKRIRLAESNKEEFAEEDCISALPDDTLVAILSRLPLKQAVVTSILSRRWRYLWTNVAELDFDADYALDTIAAAPRWRSSERSKYIKWVNRVLRQHRGLVLDGVRICFDLDISSKRTVDRWVKFAIGKRVQSLELDLLEYGEKYHQSWKNYTFPHKLLGRCKGMSLNNVYSNHALMQPSMPSCLEYLSLKSVNVSDEALDCFFSNCPDLKYLKIHGSGYLKNVKVCGLTLGLKHLEIVYCTVIETIEISNVNLEVFTYLGCGINLSVDNVPMLDEIFIGEGNSGLERNVFEQLSCCLYQLQILTLYIHRPEENKMVSAFPVLPDLKVLNLDVGAWDDESLLEFTSLIKACPKLNTFVLKLLWISPSKTRREVRQGVKCTHSYLKRVEIKGYYGRTSDAEAAMYFMENAVALKKIVIDPRERTNKRSVTISRIMKEVSARKCARKQLEPKKPHGVQLIIL